MSKDGDSKHIKLYKDKLGQRKFTLNSLRERIEDQFNEETSGRPDILGELDSREKRIAALEETADYVLATEYINLPSDEKRHIIEEAVANLFYFGPLDRYLRDLSVTEMTVEGPFRVAVRKGFGDMQSVDSPFEDLKHLERTITAMISPSGASLAEEHPFIEVGLRLHNRQVRVSVIAPPISPLYSLQLRLHPVEVVTLADLIPNTIPDEAAALLNQIIAAGRGLIVTGEVGVGKTTLIAALLNAQADLKQVVVVERAAEMQLREGITRLAGIPPKIEEETVQDFAAQISQAVQNHEPHTLVMDEIRGDESEAFWAALSRSEIPQPIIAFRGTSKPERLHSAISMVIRKRQFSLDASQINSVLMDKMPFVLALHRHQTDAPPRLSLLGQWVEQDESLTIEPLIIWDTDAEPQRTKAISRLEIG